MLSRTFTRREQTILAALACAVLTGAAVLVWLRTTEPPAAPAEMTPAAASMSATTATLPPPRAQESVSPRPTPGPSDEAPVSKVVVAVRGAVKYPGMYELAAGHRVHELLDRAGGTTDQADMHDINIAAPLVDGTTLTVPALPDPLTGFAPPSGYRAGETINPPQYTVSGWRPGASTAAVAGASGGGGQGATLIDLNRATQSELETLPGIGPVTAASIIAYREQQPFRAVEELEQVSGIGPKRLEAIRDLVRVTGP